MLVLNLLLLLVLAYFAVVTLYFLVAAAASLFPIRQRKEIEKRQRKFAVLIPGYKEDAVIEEVASDAISQGYPNDLYDVIVVADSFKQETLQKLEKLPVRVVEVSFEKSTKAKALNKAMETIGDGYDIALVLDADNLMENDCLHKINDSFNRGFIAIQAHRVAKNMNTNFAILDAISEEVNNSVYRKGQRSLGFSSGLIGSGMAFDYQYFKKTMSSIDAIGGFDKELELKILAEKHLIEYRDDALVYDEKVQKAEVFYNQRRRWVSSQGRYFYHAWGQAWKLLFRDGNLNYFNKVFQWIQPPRVLYLGGLLVISCLVYFLHPNPLMSALWLSVLLACVIAFILAVPRKFYNLSTLRAIISLPRAFALMLMATLRIKGSNKEFIHTEHGNLDEQNVEKYQSSKAG